MIADRTEVPLRRPSPSLALSSLALLVALSGTAVAAGGLVTSRDIKDRTIQVRDLSPAAIKALKGNKGDQGPQGPKGTFDPAKLTATVGAQTAVPAGVLVGAEAFCPSDSVAISGGFRISPGSVRSVRAVGEITSPTGRSHTVLLFNDGTTTEYGVAFAVCAAP